MYNNDSGIQEFATVLSIPAARLTEWSRLLQRARPPQGITITVRTPTLALFTVEDDMEFTAIGRVERWLEFLAGSALPPIPININPQPAHEV
jgi:hypothetical protein